MHHILQRQNYSKKSLNDDRLIERSHIQYGNYRMIADTDRALFIQCDPEK